MLCYELTWNCWSRLQHTRVLLAWWKMQIPTNHLDIAGLLQNWLFNFDAFNLKDAKLKFLINSVEWAKSLWQRWNVKINFAKRKDAAKNSCVMRQSRRKQHRFQISIFLNALTGVFFQSLSSTFNRLQTIHNRFETCSSVNVSAERFCSLTSEQFSSGCDAHLESS